MWFSNIAVFLCQIVLCVVNAGKNNLELIALKNIENPAFLENNVGLWLFWQSTFALPILCVPTAGFQILFSDLVPLISDIIISTDFSHKVVFLFVLLYCHTKHLPTCLSVGRFRMGFCVYFRSQGKEDILGMKNHIYCA